MPIEIIDISDDDDEIGWDLLRRESEPASVGPAVKQEEARKAMEKARR